MKAKCYAIMFNRAIDNKQFHGVREAGCYSTLVNARLYRSLKNAQKRQRVLGGAVVVEVELRTMRVIGEVGDE